MIVIRDLDRALVRRSTFWSGEPGLDLWFREQASQQERRHNVRAVLAVDDDAGRVAGSCSARACETVADAAFSRGGSAERYRVPAVLIARLAVDVDYQGRGIGRLLVADALERIARVSRTLGFEVVVVHALHEAAARFYLACGFRRFRDQPLSLFLTTRDLRATVAEVDPG
ncbi:GNAT family N-acetyltransferase [Cellulomonas sp. PS-H5]|uniref:GNAT family N-acetyltransferase n=1 Tax=Cellulomonas sp. PS-H5 TaxID=2820400 RepID=UPI001C4FF6BF|nr:GNAT family N-acetyltransferase [Cellulomonas sp. PS-H5]MBW0252906.1 GNAT family N-acetyltransferase [Cellulomonas sp. PS-H5]